MTHNNYYQFTTWLLYWKPTQNRCSVQHGFADDTLGLIILFSVVVENRMLPKKRTIRISPFNCTRFNFDSLFIGKNHIYYIAYLLLVRKCNLLQNTSRFNQNIGRDTISNSTCFETIFPPWLFDKKFGKYLNDKEYRQVHANDKTFET